MHTHKTSIDEFRKLYQEEFGKYLSERDAIEMTDRLIELYFIIYCPLPGEIPKHPMPPSEDHLGELQASSPSPE